MLYTVEPLTKDAQNKGHLYVKETCFNPALIATFVYYLLWKETIFHVHNTCHIDSLYKSSTRVYTLNMHEVLRGKYTLQPTKSI